MTKNLKHNISQDVTVGKCDYGPLKFGLRNNLKPGPLEDFSKMVNLLIINLKSILV
jgi:hypothetical protein